jgi:hypothetical protein
VPPAQPAFLDLQTTSKSNAAQFLTALVPARTDREAQALASGMTELKSGNFVGLRAGRGDETDFVMFRVGAAKDESGYQNWMTDADAWSVTQNKGQLKIFAVQNARSFKQAGRFIFSSENPASVAVNYNDNHIDVALYAATATKMQIFVGANPVKLMIDGREANPAFSRIDGTISIKVPAGEHDLKIALR